MAEGGKGGVKTWSLNFWQISYIYSFKGETKGGGDRLCPPHYYYPYIFGPYDTSEFFTSLKFDAPKFSGKTNPFLFINLTVYVMAIRVVEFSREEYEIREVFA